MTCTFAEFAEQVRHAKLAPKDCGNNHWRILGGASCVNFYPTTKRGPRMYIDGSKSGSRRSVTVADAIAAANTPPAKTKGTKRRQLGSGLCRVQQTASEQDAKTHERRTMNAAEFEAVLGRLGRVTANTEQHIGRIDLGELRAIGHEFYKHRMEMVEAEAAAKCSRCAVKLGGHIGCRSLCPACYELLSGVHGVPAPPEATEAKPMSAAISDIVYESRFERIEQRLDEIEAWRERSVIRFSDMPLDPHKPIGGPTNQVGEPCPATAAQPEAVAASESAGPTNVKLREWARQSGKRPPESWWNATDDPFTPEPAPPIDWNRWQQLQIRSVMRPLQAAEQEEYDHLCDAKALWDAEQNKAAVPTPQPDEAKQPPAPPIAVEMRLLSTCSGSWLWQCRLANMWITECDKERPCGYSSEAVAARAGAIGLAALSEQLGVPLVAKWVGEKPMPSFSKEATARRQERRASAACPPPASG